MKKFFLVSALIASMGLLTLLTGCNMFVSGPLPLSEKQAALIKSISSTDNAQQVSTHIDDIHGRVNYHNPENGRTPLMYAVITEDAEKVALLLKNGAKTDMKDKNGKTALHFAAQINSTAILKMLLDNEASVDPKDSYGRTPSMDAARLGYLRNVETLHLSGANLTELDNDKRSLTIFAAAAPRNSLPTVKWLEKKGVSLIQADKNGNTPLTTAIDKKNADTAMYLMKILPKDLQTDRGAMLLALIVMKHAIFANNQEIVKELIARKIQLNNDTSNVYKMLEHAQVENWVGTFAKTKVIADGRMPLSWAAECNNLEMVNILLDANASPLCRDSSGTRAIGYARTQEVVKALSNAEKKAMKKAQK